MQQNTVDFDGFRDGKYPEYASDCAAEMRKTTLLRDLIRMVSDGEEGKDRDSALTGSFERPKAGAGHEIKLENGGDEEAAWWKSEGADGRGGG